MRTVVYNCTEHPTRVILQATLSKLLSNSASYPQRDRKWVVANTAYGVEAYIGDLGWAGWNAGPVVDYRVQWMAA